MTAIPLKQAADKAMRSVSAKRGGVSEEDMDKEIKAQNDSKLKGHVEAICKLKEEACNIGADIKSRYDLAAEDGFDRRAIKEIVSMRTKQKSAEHKQNVNQYCLALDMPVTYRLEPTN